MHHPTINPICFYSKVLSIIWEGVLELWQAHNEDNNNDTQELPPNTLSAIAGIFATKTQHPPHAQEYIYKLTQEELLTKPRSYIQNWITNSTTYI